MFGLLLKQDGLEQMAKVSMDDKPFLHGNMMTVSWSS